MFASTVYFPFWPRDTDNCSNGFIGILHALANARSSGLVSAAPGSYLETFFAATAGKSPDEIAAYLEEDEALEETHEAAAVEVRPFLRSSHIHTTGVLFLYLWFMAIMIGTWPFLFCSSCVCASSHLDYPNPNRLFISNLMRSAHNCLLYSSVIFLCIFLYVGPERTSWRRCRYPLYMSNVSGL
jgi:hypothetical protein